MGENVTSLEEAPEVVVFEPGPEEVVKVYRLLEEWHEGTGINLPPVEPTKALHWLLELIGSPYSFLAIAELNGGRYNRTLAGVIGCAQSVLPWSRHPTVHSHLYHVTHAHRKWGVGEALADAAKAWTAAQVQTPLMLTLIQGRKIGSRPDLYYQMPKTQLIGGVFAYGLPDKGDTE